MFFMIAVLAIILAQQAFAMGVGPSRQFITFAPGQKIVGELIIINDAKEEFRAAVYPQGKLTDYIKIGNPLIDIDSTESMKRVQYEINFPLEAPEPGEHKLELVVRQFPPDAEIGDGTTISANLALISQIIVKVPYPGKFAEGRLYVSGGESAEDSVRFGVVLFNFGTEDIDDARVKVDILDPGFEKIAEVESGSASIRSKEEGKLQAVWDHDMPKGTYNAVATVFYDDKQLMLEKGFDIGRFLIDVSDISVERFTLGEVAKFDIMLFNSWNTDIEDVYVEMIVEDGEGSKMTEFKTTTLDIPAQEGKTVEAYWYTEGAAPGIYKVKLLVHYAGKVTQKEYDFEVSTNSITRLGAVGQAVTGEEVKEVSTQGLIILLILVVLVLLIGMNVVWFYFLSKQMKKGEGK